MIHKSTAYFYQNPRKLFLLDGFGALVSAMSLGIIWVQWQEYFGFPVKTLYLLASLPIFFACFDFYNYQRKDRKNEQGLRIIAFLNLIYCGISIGLAFYHVQTLTILAWLYIAVEICIVLILAKIEWGVAEKLTFVKKN